MSDDINTPELAAELEAKYRAEREKRLTADRGSYLAMTGALQRYADDPYTKPTERTHRKESKTVVIIGTGFGGLLMAQRLRAQGIEDFLMLDEAGDVGGVWYWNRYPGASCDIDSYTYLPLLEEMGYMPTERYARQSEIYAYAQQIARRYGVYERALFHTSVTDMRWDDEGHAWQIETDRGDEIRASFVVSAVGGALSRPKLPAIQGIEEFNGASFHTSRWDYRYTGGGPDLELDGLADRSVAIIGTGATALQAVPWLGRAAQKLYVVQRTPSTVAPRNNEATDVSWFKGLEPGWQRERLRNHAAVTVGEDFEEDLIRDGWSDIYWDLIEPLRQAGVPKDEAKQVAKMADLAKMERLRARVDDVVRDPAVAAKLKPYYQYLCKRPGFHDAYLDTFNRANVELVDTNGRGVDRITSDGLVVDGTLYKVDCIIYSTGFLAADDVYTERLGADITGTGGVRLSQKWAEGPATLHGIFTSGFPNLVLFPDTRQQVTQSFNFMRTLVESSLHAAYVIAETCRRGARYFDVDENAEHEWVGTVMQHAHDEDEFLASCTPGRGNGEGALQNRFPRASSYPLRTNAFFDLWDDWRQQGGLAGLRLEGAR
ncbi:flavin-containing monooxygenase [Pseudonocardia oroxyli]|uniref:Cyclohexanone monooxygenase n=1 Tax=Pseudonocardia oroxyli TaxID=366584 RepID=A0A1G8D6J6_PSEOR|nr:NAD(P)/FAD-dependent oxidoreductase [Pseudonocardia oroxyli]SDH53367.1 cyclohexanone monooxygenase [Pseudonocardia oroxyli]